MIRFGLCCKFHEQSITFKTATATRLLKCSRSEQLSIISNLILENATALRSALAYCKTNQIGSFRVNSRILPLKTHPVLNYSIEELPESSEIMKRFAHCRQFAQENDLRLTFHPDLFVLLGSPNPEINKKSIAELEYHGEVSDWIGADVIKIHGGGAYGDKNAALERVRSNLKQLETV